MQGWRLEMEDQHIAAAIPSKEDHIFLAVFDGHGGSGAANYVTQSIHDIAKTNEVEGLSPDASGTGMRIGATNYLALIASVTLSMIIMRGGWELRGICSVHEVSLYLFIEEYSY
jgi:hypothetical protein